MFRQLRSWHLVPSVQFSSVQLLSCVRLFATPWIAARQASLSITNSWSSLKVMSIKSMMPSSHLILCRPLLLLPPIPPSIRVFSNESTLRMRWPKYWSFSFRIIPSKEHPGLISLQSKWLSRVFSNTTVQKHQFFGAQLSSQSNSHIHTWPLEKPSTSWQIDGETVETVSDFIFLGSKITADGDCSHEIKKRLLLWRKVITNLDSILKSRDIT